MQEEADTKRNQAVLCEVLMQGGQHSRECEGSMSKGVRKKGSLLVQSTQLNSRTQKAISNLHTGKRCDQNPMVYSRARGRATAIHHGGETRCVRSKVKLVQLKVQLLGWI